MRCMWWTPTQELLHGDALWLILQALIDTSLLDKKRGLFLPMNVQERNLRGFCTQSWFLRDSDADWKTRLLSAQNLCSRPQLRTSLWTPKAQNSTPSCWQSRKWLSRLTFHISNSIASLGNLAMESTPLHGPVKVLYLLLWYFPCFYLNLC